MLYFNPPLQKKEQNTINQLHICINSGRNYSFKKQSIVNEELQLYSKLQTPQKIYLQPFYSQARLIKYIYIYIVRISSSLQRQSSNK